MKHKTWFRLVLKAIGIYMICTGIPGLLTQVSSLVFQYSSFSVGAGVGWTVNQWWTWLIPQAIHSLGFLMIGLYLVFGGEWIVNKCIPSNRPYCPECGYDLSQSHGEKCAECGVTLPN